MKNKALTYLQKIQPPYTKKDIPTIVITILILVGLFLFINILGQVSNYQSKAASVNSLEAETGTLAGAMTIGNDANASAGQYIQFQTSTLTPTSGSSGGSNPTTVGWRSSDYGMQDPQAVCQGPGAYSGACTVQPSYWVNAAKGMAAKFPGSQPGGIYTVGYIDNMGTAMPSQLQSVLGTMNAVHYSSAGKQADPEVMLSAFDAAGLKIVLAVEPGNADINVLATKILNKYKNHPSVIGFGVDNEWYKGEKGNVPMTAAEATTFRDTIEAVNPNYVTVIKHFNSSMLPPGIARVIYLTDTCNFNSLSAAVDDYVAWANTFSGNRVGYQFGYDAFEVGSPDDQAWWGPLGTNGQPAVAITNAILAKRPGTNIFMVYWADFTLKTQFPLNYIAPL